LSNHFEGIEEVTTSALNDDGNDGLATGYRVTELFRKHSAPIFIDIGDGNDKRVFVQQATLAVHARSGIHARKFVSGVYIVYGACSKMHWPTIPQYIKAVLAVPNIMLATMFVRHLVEMALSGEQSPFQSLLHPWMMFALLVSICMAVCHITIFVALTCTATMSTCWGFRYVHTLLQSRIRHMKVELSMLVLDATWMCTWMIQLLVQVLLPPEHRLYDIHKINTLFALYAIQFVVSCPLILYVYHDYIRLVRR